MKENCEYIQKGFRILVGPLSHYIADAYRKLYRYKWWDQILDVLNDQWDVPEFGEDEELISSLDIANCIRLLTRGWNDVFKNDLPKDCRTWANELMGVRNAVSHLGQTDIDQHTAERALDTMTLLCKEIDENAYKELKEVYQEVRAAAEPAFAAQTTGAVQPILSGHGKDASGTDLLKFIGTDAVQKTDLSRKVTYGGKTYVYPVYKVALNALFYNDQNDRISTWITQYESENGADSLSELNVDTYNQIIENFITESNPESIEKTQKNISLVGQREPGVTLTDGRIVDGNRRFSCLRRIQRETNVPQYFETVLMDVDINKDKKQIKLLELAIQHGEEKKVDYDPIDYALGTYRDITQTGLLSVEEYAASTNEAIQDVRERLDVAEIVVKFLKHIRLPEQFNAAREYKVYDQFKEMSQLNKKLNDQEKEEIQIIAFNNAMMGSVKDQRKFMRDIKKLIKAGTYRNYFDEQMNLNNRIQEVYKAQEIHTKADIERFVADHQDISEELALSMEKALQKSRTLQLIAKPSDNVSKCIDLLMDVDSRLFAGMKQDEKDDLKNQLDELNNIIKRYKRILSR